MRFYLTTLFLVAVNSCFGSNVYANETKSFISLLKAHYQTTSSIKAFSLTHSYLGRSDPYQSWDFEAPTRYKAFKVTDIDMDKQHYYQNVVHYYTGGLYFDEVHYQNNEESLRYERNGISLGKSAIAQNMNSFSRYKNLTLMNLDFFAVRPLLSEANINEKIDYQLDQRTGLVTITHRPSEKKTMEYVFSSKPLQLVSINDKSRNRVYLYDDYRHNNGFYFAHSLIKKYNGDSIPSFITRIENFEVIEEVEPEKLALPNDYHKLVSDKSRVLTSTAVSENLYLVTDESALNNVLFKVNGEQITVFGVPRGSKASRQLLSTIEQQFPTKKVTAVFVTHPYSDHISGLLPFVELGAQIYADAYTVKAIKAYPYFAKNIEKFEFETISNGQVIDDVRFYVLENTRSKRQSFAYFEQAGIVFQTDFLEVAADNTIANILPSYSKQFIDFVRREQLKVNRVVGFHRNNNISPKIMDMSYQTNTM